MTQSTGAVAPRFEDYATPLGSEMLHVAGAEARKIANQLSVGSRLELKFAGDCTPHGLCHLMDLRGRGAFVFDELGSRFVTAVYTSIDQNRRPTRPVVVELTDRFFHGITCRETFFNRLCPQLAYVRLLPD